MTLDEIRAFTVVAETGSIRRAAELLHLSPAAVSRAVARLQGDLGYQLFTPSGRGIAITDAGRDLHRRALRLLGEFEAFVTEGREGPEEGALRIGTYEVFSTHFLGWAVERFFAGRTVMVREVLPSEMEDAIRGGEIDYGITYLPQPHESLDLVKVATQRLGVFGRADRWGSTPFEELPFCIPISAVPRGVVAVQGLDGWPLNGPPRLVRYQFQMMETALVTCARGLGVMFAPPFVVDLYNERGAPEHRLASLAPPRGLRSVAIDIFLVKRRGAVESADFRRLARALREACGPRRPRKDREPRRSSLSPPR